MDDISEARSALEAWKSVVGTAPQPEPLPLVTNPLWRVSGEDGQSFVLKQLPQFPPGVGPVDEFRVVSYLQAAGIPVATPVVTDDAKIFTTTGENRYALLPFIPSDDDNHELGPDAAATAYAIGAAIAQIDKALADCPWQVRSFVDDPASEILDEALPKLAGEVADHVTPLVDQLRATVTGLPMQRTVGDCNTGNVLVQGAQVSGFIDLDHLPIGPRVRDLSYYLASRLRAHLSRPDTAERDATAMVAVLGDYVAGYHETCALSEQELAAIIPLVLLVEIGHASWCVHGWVPDPAGYRKSVHAIAWITTHMDELTSAASL